MFRASLPCSLSPFPSLGAPDFLCPQRLFSLIGPLVFPFRPRACLPFRVNKFPSFPPMWSPLPPVSTALRPGSLFFCPVTPVPPKIVGGFFFCFFFFFVWFFPRYPAISNSRVRISFIGPPCRPWSSLTPHNDLRPFPSRPRRLNCPLLPFSNSLTFHEHL